MIAWLLLIIPIAVFVYLLITEDFVSGFLGGILAGLVTILALGITYGIIESTADIDYEKTETCEISALVDNARYSHTISGSVFLIQSRTDSTLKYSYMYYEDGRGYAFNEVNASQCYINYTDGAPRLEVYEPIYASKFMKVLFGCPIFTGYDYVFYLPHNAEIIDSFVIDFE